MILTKFFFIISLYLIGVIVPMSKTVSLMTHKGLSFERLWVRPSTGPNTAAYITITNSGDQSERLIKVESADAATVELHNHIEEDGVMKMRPVNFIEIGPDPVEMKPGGLHIMLMGLKKSFQGKKEIPLTLHFEKAGKVDIIFSVKTSADEPAAEDPLPRS